MTDPRRPAFAIEKMPVRRIMHVIMRPRDPQFRNRCLVYAGLALVTLAVYLPVLYHGFVEYDDQQYVTDNPQVQAGLTWHGLIWAFGFHAGNWHPLAWLSHMLDCQLYGAQAGGHHLTSLLLHVAGTLLLFSVGGGGLVCLASAARGVGGLGGGTKRRALRLFLDAHAVAVCAVC